MPVPTSSLRRGARGDAVADLHRVFERLGLVVAPDERRGRALGESTEVLLRQFQADQQIPSTGVFDQETQDRMRTVLEERFPFVVFGAVTGNDGKPIVGAKVFAANMNIRDTNDPLGSDVTGPRGEFEIRYSAEKFKRIEKGSADLVIRVRQGDELIAESKIRFNAPNEVRIDLRSATGRGPSEYDQLLTDVELVRGTIALTDLTDADVEFVAGDTAEPVERIKFLVAAHRLRSRFDDVAAEAFYVWFRDGSSTDPDVLFAQDPLALSEVLERGCDRNIISETRRAEIPEWMAGIASRYAHALDAPAQSGALPSVGDLVRAARLKFASDDTRRRVVGVLHRMRRGPADQLIKALDEAGISPADASKLVRHQQVVELASGHLPLVRVLQDRGLISTESQAAMSLEDWREVLRAPVEGRPMGVPPGIFGETEAERLEAYAEQLSQRASTRAPMVAVFQAIESIPEATFSEYGATRQDTLRFLENNRDFVLGVDRASKLDAMSAEERDRRLDGIAAPEATLAIVNTLSQTAALVGLQTKPIVPEAPPPILANPGSGRDGLDLSHRRTVDTWKTMLESGIQSSAELALTPVPDSGLLETLAGVLRPEDVRGVADAIKDRAVQSATLMLWQRLEHRSRTLDAPAVMKIGSPVLAHSAGTADLNELFGSEDACQCAHCASVLSPSAYFVDLVDFIKEFPNPAGVEPQALWPIAARRRGDILHIPLTCENSNTALPLIDIANELLEDLIAPASEPVIALMPHPIGPPEVRPLPRLPLGPPGPTLPATGIRTHWTASVPAGRSFAPFELPPVVIADIVGGKVSRAVRDVFRWSPNAIELGRDATLATMTARSSRKQLPARQWWLVDGGRIFEINGTTARHGHVIQAMSVTAQRRQTGRSSAELRAMPEHWNLAAYEILASKLHPLPLPFDLAHEEGRAYLDELELKRADLIGAMSRTRLTGSFVDQAIAREILNLAPGEARLIIDIPKIPPATLWGYDLTRVSLWTKWLSNVPEFLRRSGLDYIQMTTLFTTRFANEDGSVGVMGPADDPLSCTLERLTITGLNQPKLGRMMRFIRLWRRCGWPMLDLDRALTALGGVDIDLESLAITKALGERLGTDLSETLTWWGDMGTTAYPDVSAPGKPPLPSLHDRLFSPTRSLRSAKTEVIADLPRRAVFAACGLSAADVDVLTDEQIFSTADVLTPDSIPLLSLLFRYGSLARALQIDIATLFRLSRITGRAPFGDPATTLAFVAAVDRLRSTPFTVDEIEYLLGPPSPVAPAPAMTADAIAESLATLETELYAIANETEVTDDPTGERLRTVLVQLGWNDRDATILRDEAASRALHSTPLVLAPDVEWMDPPPELEYDAVAATLSFAGVMRDELRVLLDVPATLAPASASAAPLTGAVVASARAAIKQAIAELYSAPATTIQARLHRLVLPVREVPLDWLPAGLVVPAHLAARLKYDPTSRTLTLFGDLEDADRDSMLAAEPAGADSVERARWQDLRTGFAALMDPALPQWPKRTSNEWQPLSILRGAIGADTGIKVLLGLALEVVRAARDREATVRAIATVSGLPVPIIARNAGSLAALKAGKGLAPADEAVAVIVRWHKVGLLANKLGLSGTQIEWLWSRGNSVGFAKLKELPALPTDKPTTFDELSTWLSFVALRESVTLWQRPIERVLGGLPTAADASARLRLIADATAWSLDSVTEFVPATELEDLRLTNTPTVLEQLARATRLARAKKVNLQDLVMAARRDLEATTSVRLRSIVQERMREKEWLKTAQRIHDELREKRRDALVAYVVNHVKPNGAPPTLSADRFESVHALFEYLLIDTQVNPCVQTSRIRQATASLQMLVERALAAEETVDPSLAVPGWKWRWETWQKRYRVWQGNLELFFHPEFWVDPALREDRTGEFKALEADLARPDLTPDAALAAYQRYLRDVDQLFHLEVVAFLPEVDANNYETSHVFARTRSAPRSYYYRQFFRDRGKGIDATEWAGKTGHWSPWERVDLDIPGDHVIPLRLGTGAPVASGTSGELALVWPAFQKAAAPDRRTPDERARGIAIPEEWRIQFHFSRYRNGRWTKKEIAIDQNGALDSLTIPHHDVRKRPHDFHFAWRGYTQEEFEPASTDKPRILTYSRIPDTFSFVERSTSPLLDTIYEAEKLRVILHSNGVAVGGRKVTATVYVDIPERASNSVLPTRVPFFSLPRSRLTFDASSYTNADGTCEIGASAEDFERLFLRNAATVRSVLIKDNTAPYPSTGSFVFPNPAFAATGVAPDEEAGKRFNELVATLVDNAFSVARFMGIVVVVEVDEDDLVATPRADAASVYEKIAIRKELSPDAPSELVLELDVLTSRWGLVDAGTLSTSGQWSPLNLPVSPLSAWGSLVPRGPWFQRGNTRVVRSSRSRGIPAVIIPGVLYEYAVLCDDAARESELGLVATGSGVSVALQPDRAEWDLLVASMTGAGALPNAALFSPASPGAPYAWEAGFHAPFAIGRALSRAGRFESAQEWFRKIFDPTPAKRITADVAQQDIERARSCWRFPPFADLKSPASSDADLLAQINAWLEAPFRPHAIAQLRPSAYMRATVMADLDNRIAWGDRLFERGTPESVDEAVLHYVRADKILGQRPARIPARATPVPHSVATLPRTGGADGKVGEYWVSSDQLSAGTKLPVGQNVVSMLLFCMTPNDRLLKYWDTVANRLFKIRNCLDASGRQRAQRLFEPPIDPGLLAAAAAAGLNVNDVLDETNLDAPTHKFGILMQKATELCVEVKSLGGQLLSALEKKDGEHLALVRAAHDKGIQDLVLGVKEASRRETESAREALEFARTSAVRRLNDARVYVAKSELEPAFGAVIEMVPVPALGLKVQNIEPPNTDVHKLLTNVSAVLAPHENVFRGGEEGSPLSGCLILEEEARELKLLEDARASQEIAEDLEKLGAHLRIIPTLKVVTTPFGVGTNLEISGRWFGEMMSAMAQGPRTKGTQQGHQASRHGRAGGFALRQAQWAQQHNQAALEVMHIDKQILGARIREEIAKKDLDLQQRQFDNAEAMERLIQEKFSSEALYTWMSQELLRLYDQAFAVALDVAKTAQRAFRYELARDDLRFIGGDYWQDGRSGLLAGERLHHDLKRMDVSYLEENRRELELTKHVSLRERFPEELFDLIETGECEIDLLESLFDADYPGHYMRRLKSVSLSIPCVAGPYTNVSCTLSLQLHRKRRDPVAGDYGETDEDPRFSYGFGPIQSIATSTGQNDAGVFEVNFRDERYLPFEGAGAISRWRLALPAAQNSYDLRTVSDVVLHLKYTARDAGGLLAKAATDAQAVAIRLRAGTLALDLRRDFPDSWAAAREPGVDLKFVLTARHFPFLPASGGAVRMLVGAPQGGPMSHDEIRIRNGGDVSIVCKRGTQTLTTFADLKSTDTEGVTVSVPHVELEDRETLIVLVDYALPSR